jgi:ribosome biogenesis GTPase
VLRWKFQPQLRVTRLNDPSASVALLVLRSLLFLPFLIAAAPPFVLSMCMLLLQFEPQQVSRFLVSLGASGLPVTLALNKCDLLPESEVTARLQQVASWGYHAIAVSCETGQGLDEVAQALKGAVSVVAGPSGAGKSSLINALRMGRHKPEAAGLVGAAVAAAEAAGAGWSSSNGAGTAAAAAGATEPHCDEQHPPTASSSSSRSSSSIEQQHTSTVAAGPSPSFLAVGDVSKIGRGRHTTRTVTLIELPFGGLMADTPGFNQPTLDRVGSADLAKLFPEFNAAVEAQGGCRCAENLLHCSCCCCCC